MRNFAVAVLMLMGSIVFGGGFSLQEENDAFGVNGQDGYYTQGLLLQYIGDSETYGKESERHLYGLRNTIYTPSDIAIAAPQPDDRPWAGLTAFSYTTWISKKDEFFVREWMAGVVGEWSKSDELQTKFHKWIGAHTPMGWSNQIPNEVVCNYTEDRYYRMAHVGENLEADFAQIVGYSIGTAFDYLKVGGIGRAGWNLPEEYRGGTIMPTIERQSPYSAFLFAGLEYRAVVHNIMLGGSLWQDGPQQDLKNLVVDAKAGLTLAARSLFGSGCGFEITLQEIWRSMEFMGQKEQESFGTITLMFAKDL
jgi:hypothetical protein